VCSGWRDGGGRRCVVDHNDFAEPALAVKLLDLAIADGVLMSAFALSCRHGGRLDRRGWWKDGKRIERLVLILGQRCRMDSSHWRW